MKKIGLIVNPIAGIGGRVGLKGSDTENIQKQAGILGATREAGNRVNITLKELLPLTEKIALFTAPMDMGENSAKSIGFSPIVVGKIDNNHTTAEDTINIAKAMAALKLDLLVFTGGDGTASDIFQAIGTSIPALGIPAGVKIHSAVYAVNPQSAGKAIEQFLSKKHNEYFEAEVMDIDEEAFRNEQVKTKLIGFLKVPLIKNYIQSSKSGGYFEKEDLYGIAAEINNNMRKGVFYIFGPGTTTGFIMKSLQLPYSLLGVDVVLNRQLIASDVNEQVLLQLIKGKESIIIVTVIGGQGHVFGRGNQQISPEIIRMIGKENIVIVATKNKLFDLSLKPLLLDTGDEELNESLSGWVNVITGYKDSVMYRIEG